MGPVRQLDGAKFAGHPSRDVFYDTFVNGHHASTGEEVPRGQSLRARMQLRLRSPPVLIAPPTAPPGWLEHQLPSLF
jgi:hypothetical protein